MPEQPVANFDRGFEVGGFILQLFQAAGDFLIIALVGRWGNLRFSEFGILSPQLREQPQTYCSGFLGFGHESVGVLFPPESLNQFQLRAIERLLNCPVSSFDEKPPSTTEILYVDLIAKKLTGSEDLYRITGEELSLGFID